MNARSSNGLVRARNALLLVTIVLASSFIGGQVWGQQNDEQRRFLEVRRRQLELQAVQKQFERTEKLAAQGLLAQTDVDRDRNAVASARLNYQQAVLTLLDLQPRISVRSAVKIQSGDGRKFVRLVLANLTPTFDDSQFKLLNNFEGSERIPEQLRTRIVSDIFVSLRDNGSLAGADQGATRSASATISLPYEIHIQQMEYGEAKTLNYQLLRDVDSVVVALTYRNQTQEVPIQLQHAAGGSDIQVSSSQFSQEADLGGQATYNLTLERPSVDVRNFQLRVVNLPRQISYSFIDPQSQARLSEINFPAGVTRQSLGLRLSLPQRADDDVRVDQALEFWALGLDETAARRFSEERTYAPGELDSLKSGRARLVLIPRGLGRIEVMAPSLFSEIEAGQTVEGRITLRNTGTRRLDNVRLWTEYPLNWRVDVEPENIGALEINREDAVLLRIVPSPDVGVGDYEVRIKTESFADNRRVQSEDKIYRVSVKRGSSLVGTGALMGGLLLVLSGIVFFSMRMARR